MRHLYGIALAAALVVGITSDAHAQLSISLGNPYNGSGVVIGNNPYGYGGYAPGYGGYAPGYGGYAPGGYGGYPPGYSIPRYTTSYSSSYYGVAPATSVFSSGYSGYAPQVYGPSYPSYGYGGYGYRRAPGVYMPFGRSIYRRW